MQLSLQRRGALRVISVSAEAALVVASLIPLDSLPEERERLFHTGTEHRAGTRREHREISMAR